VLQRSRGNRLVQWGSGAAWYATPESLGVMTAILFKAMGWERPEFISEGEPSTLTFNPPSFEVADGFSAIMDDEQAQPQWDGNRGIRIHEGIATIPVTGPIFRRADMFTAMCGGATTDMLMGSMRAALSDRTIRGIILEIDSPGGEAAGIAELALFVRQVSESKPVVAYIDGDGASAAYFIASAASKVVTSPSGVVGCIGTLMTIANPAVKDGPPKYINVVSSQSPRKVPDASTDEGMAQYKRFVDAQAQVFIDHVAVFMGTTPKNVEENFGQGDVFIGQAAVDAGLAHSVGTYDSVVKDMLESFRDPARSQGGRTMARTSALEKIKALFMDPEVVEAMQGDPTLLTAGLPVHNPVTQDEEVPVVEEEAVQEEPVAFHDAETRALLAQLETSSTELEAARAELTAKETALQAEMAAVRAEAAANRQEAVAAQALNWAKAEVLAGRADPAELDDLRAQYMEAVEDDAAMGPRSSADGQVTRVSLLQARTAKRPVSTITGEVIAVIPEGAVAIPNKLQTPSKDEKVMTAAERRKALMATEFGQAVLAREDAAAKAQ
jgi:ClpP class serine protease